MDLSDHLNRLIFMCGPYIFALVTADLKKSTLEQYSLAISFYNHQRLLISEYYVR